MGKNKTPYFQVNLRMPEHLMEWIENRAKVNMRTRHSEIMFLFEMIKKEDEKKECS